MNKPLKYLKFLMADPVKDTQSSTLPDHTTCETKGLQQGYKWRTHESFQQPSITLDNGNDVWGIDLKEDLNSEYITYFKGFPVKYIGDNAGTTFVAIDRNAFTFSIWSIYQKVDKTYYDRFSYCPTSFDANHQRIALDHKALYFEPNSTVLRNSSVKRLMVVL
ncbi:hypothetical protein EDC96DRAFT_582321 [Choanephora cucurbitarum]|nr:hypothetical protein EDC96DRAFT_582321 [Choanephora cucurbitarum]